MGRVCTLVLPSSNRWPFLLPKRRGLKAWVIGDQEAVGGGRSLITAVTRAIAAGEVFFVVAIWVIITLLYSRGAVAAALRIVVVHVAFIALVVAAVRWAMCCFRISMVLP